MSFVIDVATSNNVEELLHLYFKVYGNSYPFELCTNREVMENAINNKERYLWLVAKDTTTHRVIGSSIIEKDITNKIGKLEGVVVDPDKRQQGVASTLIMEGTRELINENKGILNSIYATTRTVSIGPQLMCLKAGFQPFGIFPNSHRLVDYETTTLMIKYKKSVLQNRAPLPPIPKQLEPILNIVNTLTGHKEEIHILPKAKTKKKGEPLEFEVIQAPSYVFRKFIATFNNPYDCFYPFHTPNTLITATNGEIDIFAYLNRKYGYCAIISNTKPFFLMKGRFAGLIRALENAGATYVEVLIGIEHTRSIQALLNAQFLPCAVYPAMQEIDGKMYDFVVMSRTMELINFKGIAIIKQFKPFVDQYIKIWKSMYLDTIEVLDKYEDTEVQE